LRKDEKEIRRILDPRHPTKLASLTERFASLDSSSSLACKPLRRYPGNGARSRIDTIEITL
jgi:hypothetical protein